MILDGEGRVRSESEHSLTPPSPSGPSTCPSCGDYGRVFLGRGLMVCPTCYDACLPSGVSVEPARTDGDVEVRRGKNSIDTTRRT